MSLYRKLKVMQNRRGSILVEFAIILPIFLLIIFPTIDFSRYVLLQQKVIKTAYVMADSVAMSRPVEPGITTQIDIDQDGTFLTQDFLQGLVELTEMLMSPFPEEENTGPDSEELYNAEITHISNDTSSGSSYNPVMNWIISQNVPIVQFPPGIPTTLPESMVNNLDEDENLIRVVVRAKFKPITPSLVNLGVPFLSSQTLTHTSYFRARYGDLSIVWVNGEAMPSPSSPTPTPPAPLPPAPLPPAPVPTTPVPTPTPPAPLPSDPTTPIPTPPPPPPPPAPGPTKPTTK